VIRDRNEKNSELVGSNLLGQVQKTTTESGTDSWADTWTFCLELFSAGMSWRDYNVCWHWWRIYFIWSARFLSACHIHFEKHIIPLLYYRLLKIHTPQVKIDMKILNQMRIKFVFNKDVSTLKGWIILA